MTGPTTPSTSSPWADWNARTARRVLAAEHAVGGDPQHPLHLSHGGAAAPDAQQVDGRGAGHLGALGGRAGLVRPGASTVAVHQRG